MVLVGLGYFAGALVEISGTESGKYRYTASQVLFQQRGLQLGIANAATQFQILKVSS